MKKMLCTLLAVAMLTSFACAALAQEESKAITLSGNVVAGETMSIKAPFGGAVEDFALRAGDLVAAGDSLFTLSTTKIYAPCDGTVAGLFAQPGDEAQYVSGRYGALLNIEPSSPFTINASTAEAYDSNDNRIIHVGETVYLTSVNNSDRKGVGFVTSVNGKSYTVEVTEGTLRFDEKVTIYRSSGRESTSRIGSGRTARIAVESIVADGSVLAVHVTEGAQIKRGDLLLEMVSGALPQRQAVSGEVTANVAGVVASVEVTAGSTVSKDQVLATVYPVDKYQIAAEINEMDLSLIAIGDAVELSFLGLKEQDAIKGTIASISALSSTSTGDAEYTVTIDFDADPQVRLGMSVTVSLAQ